MAVSLCSIVPLDMIHLADLRQIVDSLLSIQSAEYCSIDLMFSMQRFYTGWSFPSPGMQYLVENLFNSHVIPCILRREA